MVTTAIAGAHLDVSGEPVSAGTLMRLSRRAGWTAALAPGRRPDPVRYDRNRDRRTPKPRKGAALAREVDPHAGRSPTLRALHTPLLRPPPSAQSGCRLLFWGPELPQSASRLRERRSCAHGEWLCTGAGTRAWGGGVGGGRVRGCL